MIEGKSVLYVEDDRLSREVMQRLLKTMGITRLVMFEDSQDFMPRLKALEQLPDVILMDIHMQPVTGFELLKMVRGDANLEKTPVVALTASVMNEEIELLRNSGFDGVIGKPVRLNTFPDLLSRVMRGDAVWHVA